MTAYLISLALVGLLVIAVIGGILVSIDIIQFILCPRRDDPQTFRSRRIRSGLLRPSPHLRPQGRRGH
jgi:hypothetical protein